MPRVQIWQQHSVRHVALLAQCNFQNTTKKLFFQSLPDKRPGKGFPFSFHSEILLARMEMGSESRKLEAGRQEEKLLEGFHLAEEKALAAEKQCASL
jgi:hypothetical protein